MAESQILGFVSITTAPAEAPANAYPPQVSRSQPWKQWMKIVNQSTSGEELIVCSHPLDAAEGRVGGF
jgi:hypothetical protein